MISFDTVFTAIVALVVFYGTILTTLLIEKKKETTFNIKSFVIVLTIVCVLILSIALILYFGYIPFVPEIIARIKSMLLEGTSFALEYFYIIYLCGVVAFLPCGIIGCCDALDVFSKIMLRVVYILINIFATILIPYFSGSIIYSNLYDISFLLTVIVSLLVNFVFSLLIIFVGALICILDFEISK